MCPCEESTDEPTQSETSTTGQGRRRWGFKRHPRQGANVKSTWPGCEIKLGTCHCCNTTPTVRTRIPELSSPTTGGSSVVVIHPRGPSDETTSLGQWVQRWKGSQLQAIKPSHLDDFCSANNCLQEGQQGCGRTGGAIQQHLKPISRDCISSSSTFSGGPVTRSKRTHQWMSGVTMLVRWLCSSPASERLLWWVCKPRSSPASENAPLGKKGHVNQQAASFQRPPRRPAQVVLLSLDCARNAPYYLDKVRVREGAVGPSFSQTATSRVPGYGGDLQNEKSKDKGKRPHPEENRQREWKTSRSPS